MRLLVALAGLSLASAAPAATLTWDADPASPGAQDGAGAWDAANTNWWDGAANTNWTGATPDSAVFGSGGLADTVTLSQAISVSNITFAGAAGGYTIQGGTITVASASTFTALTNATIGSVLAGGRLVKAGGGTLALTGANTYGGGTAIDAGRLQIGSGAANGTIVGAYAVAGDAVLHLNYATAIQRAWTNLAGAGTLELASTQAVNGTANWGLNSAAGAPFAAGFTGTLQLDNGRLDAPPAGLGGITNLIVRSGAQFLAWSGTYNLPATIAGQGWGEAGYSGGLRLAGGAVGVWAGAITLSTSSYILAQSSSTFTLAGPIRGEFLNEFDAQSGASLIVAPTAAVQNAYGVTKVTGSGSVVAGNAFAFSTNGLLMNGGTLKLNGNGAGFAYLSGSSGTLGNYQPVTNCMATVGADNSVTNNYSGAMVNGSTGTLGLVKIGSGTQTLSGAGIAYTGPTSIGGGALRLSGTTAFSSPLIVDAGSAIFHVTANETYSRTISGTGGAVLVTSPTNNVSLTWTGSATNTYTGRVILGESPYRATGGTLVLANTNGGAIQGAMQIGTRTNGNVFLQMGAANQFGPGAQLIFTNASGQWGYFKLMGFNQTIASVRDPYGSAVIEDVEGDTAGAAILTIDNTDASDIRGFLRSAGATGGSGTLGLIKAGTGTLTLTGGNINYTGPTTVSNGALVIAANTAFNSLATIGAAGLLQLSIAPGDVRLNQGLAGPGPVQVVGGGSTARVAGDDSAYAGTFTLPQGARGMMWSSVGAGSAQAVWDISGQFGLMETGAGSTTTKVGVLTGSNAVSVVGAFNGSGVKTLEVGGLGIACRFPGVIGDNPWAGGTGTGTVALNKVGAGTFTLAGANTYSGATIIDGGVLALGSGGSIAGSAFIAVGSNSVFDVSAAAFTLGAGKSLRGYGVVTGSVAAAAAAVLAPGSIGGAGTLTINGPLTLSAGTTNLFDLAGTTNAGENVNDLLLVSGDLAPNGSTIAVNPLAPLTNGTYRLIQYGAAKTSSFNPAVAGFVTATRQSIALDEASEPGRVNLVVAGNPAALAWNSAGDTNWDVGTSTNWLNTGSGSNDVFFAFDDVTFGDAPGAVPAIALNTIVQPASWTIAASTNAYVFSGGGRVTGLTGLNKGGTGTATLAVSGTNDFAGAVAIHAGELVVAGTSLQPLGAGAISNEGVLGFSRADSFAFTNAIVGGGSVRVHGPGLLTLTAANSYGGGTVFGGGILSVATLVPGGVNSPIGTGSALTFDGGTLRYTGGANGTDALATEFNPAIVVGAGGGTLDTTAAYIHFNGSLAGSGALNIISSLGGGFQWLWHSSSPAFEGPINIGTGSTNSGWLQYRSSNPAPLGTNVITINGGGVLSADTGSPGSPSSLANPIVLNGGFLGTQTPTMTYSGRVVAGSATSTVGHIANGSGDVILAGNLSGSGTVSSVGGLGVKLAGDNGAFAGTWLSTGAQTWFNAEFSGSAGARWVANGNNFIGSIPGGGTVSLGALSGTTGTLKNDVAATTLTFSIGALGLDTAFGGAIADKTTDPTARTALTKVGAGRLTLSGTNTFSGGTAVSNGTLVVNSLAGTGGVVIESGAILGGTGVISGPVTQNGVIAPGDGIGTLTVSNQISCGGAAVTRFELGGTNSYDQLVATDLHVLSGTLDIVTTNGYSPAAGDRFTLITNTAPGGLLFNTFAATQSPALAPGLFWDVQYSASAVTLVVTAAPPVSGYDLWAQSITNAPDRGYRADPDGDGFANLWEYSQGTDPTNAADGAKVLMVRTGGVCALVFNCMTSAVDLVYEVEASYVFSNNASWSAIASNQFGTGWISGAGLHESGTGAVRRVTAEDDDPLAPVRGMRLRVTRP